jgi:hypothetical protein
MPTLSLRLVRSQFSLLTSIIQELFYAAPNFEHDMRILSKTTHMQAM